MCGDNSSLVSLSNSHCSSIDSINSNELRQNSTHNAIFDVSPIDSGYTCNSRSHLKSSLIDRKFSPLQSILRRSSCCERQTSSCPGTPNNRRRTQAKSMPELSSSTSAMNQSGRDDTDHSGIGNVLLYSIWRIALSYMTVVVSNSPFLWQSTLLCEIRTYCLTGL